MPTGGNISPFGGFSFLAVTALAEAVKPKYGGNWVIVGNAFLGGHGRGSNAIRR